MQVRDDEPFLRPVLPRRIPLTDLQGQQDTDNDKHDLSGSIPKVSWHIAFFKKALAEFSEDEEHFN